MPTIDEIIDKHTYTFSVTECVVQDVDKLRAAIESAIREERAAERERCAVTAWNHHMDRCKHLRCSPSDFHEWCAAEAIRALKD